MALEDFLTQAGSDLFGFLLNLGYILGLASLIIFLIIHGIRAMKRYGQYAGNGTPLGPFTIMPMDGTHVTGNVSKDDFFAEEMFEKLKSVEEKFNISFADFKKLILDKVINIYDFKITDHSKAWQLTNVSDMKLVVLGKMESDNFSWRDAKGRFSITGAGFKEFPRNVVGWKGSRIHKILDPWNKEIDVMYLELIPREEAVKILSDMGKTEISLHIEHHPQSEKLAIAVEYLPVIVNMYKQFEIDSNELRLTKEALVKEQQAHATTNAKLNKARHLLTEKIFVGIGKAITPYQKGIEWGFIVGSYWLGWIVIKQLLPTLDNQQNYPQPPATIYDALIPIGAFVIIVAVRIMMEKRKPLDQEMIEQGGEANIL